MPPKKGLSGVEWAKWPDRLPPSISALVPFLLLLLVVVVAVNSLAPIKVVEEAEEEKAIRVAAEADSLLPPPLPPPSLSLSVLDTPPSDNRPVGTVLPNPIDLFDVDLRLVISCFASLSWACRELSVDESGDAREGEWWEEREGEGREEVGEVGRELEGERMTGSAACITALLTVYRGGNGAYKGDEKR